MKVGRAIELFVAMGCELHALRPHVRDLDEETVVRFLYNPETSRFASLAELEDDDRVSDAQLSYWELDLGVTIPRG